MQLKGHGICTDMYFAAQRSWNLATVHIWKWSFKTGNFVLLFTKQGGLWLGMTGGLSTQVKMNVKPIGAFKSGLIRQVVVFESRGPKIQGPL